MGLILLRLLCRVTVLLAVAARLPVMVVACLPSPGYSR